ncbi:MAG: ABC transporter permease [Fimbriiglobus sp.]|nr:ABC transporter permease [Fimbriiglobus sp.]
MIRALLWKEAREQGLIVGALAVLGLAVLLGLGILNGSTDQLDSRTALTNPGVLSVVMLTITAGAVVGGTLFAYEKENGTDVLLGMMPVRRRAVWAGKMAAGAALVLPVTGVLFGAAAAVRLLGSPAYLPLWAVGLGTLALATLGWASVGSAFSRTSLAAAGWGVVLLVGATLVLVPCGIGLFVFGIQRAGRTLPPLGAATTEVTLGSALLFTLVAIPAVVSYWLYTAPDRDRVRRAVEVKATGGRPRPRRPGLLSGVWRWTAGIRAALWMSLRQQRRFTLVLAAVGAVCGLTLLAPAAPFVAVWPPVAFFLAVLVGVVGWYDEQTAGAKRFWVERRLPAARLWWAKVTVGALATTVVTLAALVPVAVKAWVARRDPDAVPSYLLTSYHFPLFTFVLMWPAYGFAFGHVVGMLFRKTVVAAAVAAMVGAVAAAVWLPSVLGGGLHPWQVWAPLVGVFATARALAWACAADTVGTFRGLIRLAFGTTVTAAAVGGGLMYRMIEIPDDPARNADEVFKRDQIPPFDTNLAGQEYRRAGSLLQEAVAGRGSLQDAATIARMSTPANAAFSAGTFDQHLPRPLAELVETTLEHGWTPSEQSHRLLTQVFGTGWDESAAAAARLPLGTLEDPRDLTLNSPLRHLDALTGADALLLTRGLKSQYEGDPERFVQDFSVVLNLSRTIRNKSVQGCAAAGRRVERRAVQGFTRWLERLHGREDLLTRIESLLAEHDAVCGDDAADVRLADQVVLRNTFRQSGEVLRRQWRFGQAGEEVRVKQNAEADLVGVAWQMPWEQERQERLIARGNIKGYGNYSPDSPFLGLPGVDALPHVLDQWYLRHDGFSAAEGMVQSDRRAARTLIAIRRFEMKNARPPKALAELVPEFLPAVPLDPFNKQPFRYRLSTGEQIEITSRTQPRTPILLTDIGMQVVALSGGLAVPAEPDTRPLQPPSPNNPTEETPSRTDLRFTVSVGFSPEPLWLKEVPAGRPVLWGIGPDRVDNGGTKVNSRAFVGDAVYFPPPIPADRR